MTWRETWALIPLAATVLLLGVPLALTWSIRLYHHLRWSLARWSDRRGRNGNLLEELARKIEGGSW